MNQSSAAVLAAILLGLGGCATQQGAPAPIEERRVGAPQPTVPVPAVRAPTPAPRPAPLPETGAVVRALPDDESPGARALALPAPGEVVPLPAPADAGAGQVGGSFVPAVTELVARADEASAAGRHDAARASLERALKISPRDAALWHRLATVSYAQEDWAQAKSLAERSNSFAAAGSALLARNWMLIGNAETRLGNQSAAAEAFARAGAAAP